MPRQYIKAARKRPDLRAEPHGWRVPRPVRVSVAVTELGMIND